MGLCKCPKRKTTSHFCFHHCVNVCEHCIVNNHTTCVVKSYTTWLKEASGSVSSSTVSATALCAVCQKHFAIIHKDIDNITTNFNNRKTAIRLLCYHVVHAHCLAVYVKNLLKNGNILKCPSCVRPLWLHQQEQSQDPNNTTEVDSIELSPVASLLYKHLLDHGNWWGQALITNGKVEDLEKYLLEENEYEEIIDEQFDQSFDIEQQINTVPNNTPFTLDQTIQSPNSKSDFYNFNNSELVHSSDLATINHRSNTHQTYQPIHHRHFNSNYGIDSAFIPQQQHHHPPQQQCSSVNMPIPQGSDLSNRHAITSSAPLLLKNDSNLNNDEEQDPSKKYRLKKLHKQSWSLIYQRLSQYFLRLNNREEESTKITIIIILCILVLILLIIITSLTRSNYDSFDPFDNNNIDYGGEDDHSKINGESNL